MNKIAFDWMRFGPLAAAVAVTVTLTGCNSGQASSGGAAKPEPPARPVSYALLKESTPARRSLVTGSVDSWKKEQVGFQVHGQVDYVREPGVFVDARIVEQGGNILEPGTLVASLGNERYRLLLEEAKANVAELESMADAARAEVDKTIPSELREVEAELVRARKEMKRQQRMLKQGAGAQSYVEKSRAEYKEAQARYAKLEARKAERQASLAGVLAKVREAEEAAERAKVNLEDTRLYSPFGGQVSQVHVIPGGYAERGQPVATIQMMDPMKVEIAVSPGTDQQIGYNDLLKVYVEGSNEPLDGWVWHRDPVADAATRTFMVTLLVRNRLLEVGTPTGADREYTTTSDLWSVESENDDGKRPFLVSVDALHRDEKGYYVWQAEGVTLSDLEREIDSAFKVKKVRVTPGDHYRRLLGIMTFRELTHLGGLNPETDLVVGKLSGSVVDGDEVAFVRKQWMLRPGQLVRVDLNRGEMPKGYYVPAQSIIKDQTGHHVFVAKATGEGKENASRIDVRVANTFGTLQAVEPHGGKSLSSGMKLIVDGAHYVRDGDPVNAFEQVEAHR